MGSSTNLLMFCGIISASIVLFDIHMYIWPVRALHEESASERTEISWTRSEESFACQAHLLICFADLHSPRSEAFLAFRGSPFLIVGWHSLFNGTVSSESHLTEPCRRQ